MVMVLALVVLVVMVMGMVSGWVVMGGGNRMSDGANGDGDEDNDDGC